MRNRIRDQQQGQILDLADESKRHPRATWFTPDQNFFALVLGVCFMTVVFFGFLAHLNSPQQRLAYNLKSTSLKGEAAPMPVKVPWEVIDVKFRKQISRRDEKFRLASELSHAVDRMSLDLRRDYGHNKPKCTYDPAKIDNQPLDLNEWYSNVSRRTQLAIVLASGELAHEISSDINEWRLDYSDPKTKAQAKKEDRQIHALSVLVRTDAEDWNKWNTRCLDKLLGCKEVDHIFVSFWGPGIQNAFKSREHDSATSITFIHTPRDVATRFFLNTTSIRTPYILSLDGDRCATCKAIRKSLKSLYNDSNDHDMDRITKVVGGWVSLRGLTRFRLRHNPKEPPCQYYPDSLGTTHPRDFAAYFLPSNSIYSKRYLEYYRDMIPTKLFDLVNEHEQCEDLMMSFFQLLFQFRNQKQALTPFEMENGLGYNISWRDSQARNTAIRPKCLDFFLTLSMQFNMYPHALDYKF